MERQPSEATPRVPSLLFWQVCVLAGLAGVLASQYPLPGLLGGIVLIFALGPLPWPRRLVLVLSFILAACYAAWSMPVPGQTPDWLQAAQKIRITGDVVEVSGQPDRRLRILLENVRPADLPDALPLPGRVNWSWDQGQQPDAPRPLPGQCVRLTTKIRPIIGFANEGVSDSASYWAARDVWHTAWTMADKGQVEISGHPEYFAALRESWRQRMVAALGGSSPVFNNGRSSPAQPVENLQGMPQARAVLPALIFGDRYALDSATLDLFTRAGLVHSLALSGQHLVLAATAAALVVWFLSLGNGRMLLRLPRRTLILIAGVPFAALYLWIGSAPLSLIRAALMMLFGALLWLSKRPATLLDLLFFAALCFLLAWPQAMFDLSVQLSMLSVTGIALAMPLLRALHRWIGALPWPRVCIRTLQGTALMLATSLAVQIPTIPLLLSTFGRVSPLFPLNLLWLPVLEVVVMPLTAIGLLILIPFGSQPVSDLLFYLATLPTQGIIALLDGMFTHHALPVLQGLKPTGLATLGYAAALAALTCLLGRSAFPCTARRLVLCAMLLLPLGAVQREADAFKAGLDQRVVVRVLDVGQGQALVVEWPGGRLLLDGGGSISPRFDTGRDVVAPALTVNRAPRLHTVMASHGDLDHAHGLVTILELFDVGTFARSALPLSGAGDDVTLENIRFRRDIPLQELQAGDTIPLAVGLSLEIIHPPDKGRFSSNNGSLVVRLVREGHGLALMCGDAQNPALRKILRSGRDIRAEVLVVPHHGSATSLLPEFYDAVAPDIALISCGSYNSFGFPKPQVLEALALKNIQTLDTATYGELRATWTRNSPRHLQAFRIPLP